MTKKRKPGARRRFDRASVVLLLIGLACGAAAYWLIVDKAVTPIVLVPAIVSMTVAATHLRKWEAPHS